MKKVVLMSVCAMSILLLTGCDIVGVANKWNENSKEKVKNTISDVFEEGKNIKNQYSDVSDSVESNNISNAKDLEIPEIKIGNIDINQINISDFDKYKTDSKDDTKIKESSLLGKFVSKNSRKEATTDISDKESVNVENMQKNLDLIGEMMENHGKEK